MDDKTDRDELVDVRLSWKQIVTVCWLISNLCHHQEDFKLDKPADWEGAVRTLWDVLDILGTVVGIEGTEPN